MSQINLLDTLFGGQDVEPLLGDPTNPNSGGPMELIQAILPNIYLFASLILLAYLIFGGFMFVTAAGSEQKSNGQQVIFNAIIGYLIIFTSYWIISLIQVFTGVEIVNL